ncbi:uncharacterized protein METZ01_LOCUS247256, partial [marine metagenome]
MAKPVKRLNPNWRQRIKEIGKGAFQREEMLILGFWKPKELNDKQFSQANQYLRETVDNLAKKRQDLADAFKKIKEAQDVEKIISEIRQKRIERSKITREKRRLEKQEQKKIHDVEDKRRRLVTPPFLGKGVSGKLLFEGGDNEKRELQNLPPLKDMADLSSFLDVELGKMSWLSYHRQVTKCDHYWRFKIPKRNGSHRIIASPKTYLRNVQYWINSEILSKIAPEPEATAFRKQKNILNNASPHCGQGIVIRVDLMDFFFSITFPRVRGLFESLGYNPGIASILALLCTDGERRKVVYKSEDWYVCEGIRRLPQGAVTSPALSNLIARKLDRRVRGYLTSQDLKWTYTRYADDLVLSHPKSDAPVGKILKSLDKIISDEGFSINEKKTAIMRNPHRQMITGLVL